MVLPCSVQNVKTIGQLQHELWINEILWDLCSRWLSERSIYTFPIAVQCCSPGLLHLALCHFGMCVDFIGCQFHRIEMSVSAQWVDLLFSLWYTDQWMTHIYQPVWLRCAREFSGIKTGHPPILGTLWKWCEVHITWPHLYDMFYWGVRIKVRSHCVRVRIRFSIRFSFRVRRTVYTESEFLSVFDLISCPQLPHQTSKCDFV